MNKVEFQGNSFPDIFSMLDKYRKFMYVKNYIIIYRKGTLIMLFNSYEILV